MLALPKVTLKRSERNGTKMIIEKCSTKVCGAQWCPTFQNHAVRRYDEK